MAVTLLGNVEVGSIVKLNENGSPVDFIVVQQGPPSDAYYGFENVTLALRKDAHSIRKFNSTANSDYENSDINKWLSDEENGYLSLLDADIRRYIHAVKIPYRPGSGGTSFNVSSGEDGLQVKAFLPSIKEIYNRSGDVPEDGSILQYFADLDPSKRACYYNGSSVGYWTRTPFIRYDSKDYVVFIHDASQNFASAANYSYFEYGIRPAIPIPSNFHVDENGNVYIVTPSSPGSIDVSDVVYGKTSTITLTAATSPDSTIASYIFERQVDGGEDWVQIANTNSLTCKDAISEDWATVAYRACAVDDKGVSGPYVTSETYVVNAGCVIISGPNENLGDKPVTFDFNFTLSVSGEFGTEAIDYIVELDSKQIKSSSVNENEQVSVQIETRTLGSGSHVITVSASKDLFVPTVKTFTFNIPTAVLPEAGKSGVFYGPDGNPLYPLTLAQQVIGLDGKDIGSVISGLLTQSVVQMEYGTYVGTGTYGEDNPNSLTFSFEPQIVIIGESQIVYWFGTSVRNVPGLLIWIRSNGNIDNDNCAFNFSEETNTLTWYTKSGWHDGSTQLNMKNINYAYIAIGYK